MKRMLIEALVILAIYFVLRGIADLAEADQALTYLFGWIGGVIAMSYLREVESRRRWRSDEGGIR